MNLIVLNGYINYYIICMKLHILIKIYTYFYSYIN